jgi:hypothetical protein
MKASYLINLSLIFLLAGLYWFNNHSNEQTGLSTRLTNTDSKIIQRITISQVSRADIVLDKIADQWFLSAPLIANANPTRINLLLSLLNIKTERQLTVTHDQDLSPFGLTENSTQLVLGQKHFKFGNIEPISKQRYVLHNQTIYLLEDRISPLLNTNASSFIDNRLIPAKQEITAIDLPLHQDQSLSTQTVALKLVDGHWQTEQDFTADKLVELIDNWGYARALQVIPLDAIATKFKPAHFYVNLILDNEEAMRLTLHLNDSSFFIINESTKLAYQFPQAMYLTLLLPSLAP